MTRYVREVKVETEFDGDKLTATLRPLLFEDALALQSLAGSGEAAMLTAYGKLLSKYLIRMDPVHDADNGVVPLEELISVTYFQPLIVNLMRAHMRAAKPADPTSPVDPPEG